MDRKPRHSASNGTSKPLSREALRKANHSMIERRRREKINHAFSELRGMVPGLGGGGEGMKGEFKLEVLEKTVEHMRLLMNRLDVLESRQHQSQTQPQSQSQSRSQPQPSNHRTAAAATGGAGPSKEEKSRKRKRMISTPTTVTSSSSSLAESRGRMYHPAPTVRGEKRYRADTEDTEEDEEDEEEDGKEGSSSDEEPLVARPVLSVGATLQSRTKPEYQDQMGTGILTPQRILHDLEHQPRSRHCYPYEPGHVVVVSQPIGMARILNPTPLTTPSIPAATTTPVLKNRPPLLDSLAVLNSPTPSRTDSEATVLEENLPEGGSDSGLDFSLGLVDGIAVRVGPTQTGRMEGIVVGDQPTPISSLALAHQHQQYQRHPSFSSRFAFPGSGSGPSTLGSTSGVAMSTGTNERNKKDLFLSNPTELSPLSPFIIGTSSSSTSSGSHSGANSHSTPMSVLGGTSRNGQMVLPEPSPLLPPMMQRQSIAGLFELDPISSGSRSRSGSGSGSGSGPAAMIAISEEEQRGGTQGDPRVDEQEAANILLALSSPESMAPTPWHSATRGGDNSPPGAFLLDVPAEDLDVGAMARNEKMEDESEFDLEPTVISRSTTVTSSARGGRLAKSARDFLNLREDAFGFALTQVG